MLVSMTDFEKNDLAKWRFCVEVTHLIQSIAVLAIAISLLIHILN